MGLEGLQALLWDDALAWLAEWDAIPEADRPPLTRPKYPREMTAAEKQAHRADMKRALSGA